MRGAMSVRKADDANRRLIEALGHLYSELSGERRREGGEGTDGNVNHSSVRSAVGEVSFLVLARPGYPRPPFPHGTVGHSRNDRIVMPMIFIFIILLSLFYRKFTTSVFWYQ